MAARGVVSRRPPYMLSPFTLVPMLAVQIPFVLTGYDERPDAPPPRSMTERMVTVAVLLVLIVASELAFRRSYPKGRK